MKTKRKALLITLALMLSACVHDNPTKSESDSLEPSSTESLTQTSYEGESTMYVYEVFMDKYRKVPEGARFDTTYTVKNGEPIMERESYESYQKMLSPDLDRLAGGTGSIYVHYFYYDFECKMPVEFGEIATKDLNLFYYTT